MTVRTRFAPSPTGYLHIGGARTALFNYLFARHHRGKFLLRIEDTDVQRSTDEAKNSILQSLHWLDLEYDETIVYQSARADRHRQIAKQLVQAGKAYYCFSSQQEIDAIRQQHLASGKHFIFHSPWRDQQAQNYPLDQQPVVRLKTPRHGITIVNDLVQGVVSVQNEHIDDMILLRQDESPTYMLAATVDDHDMDITHIIRGDDHLNNAPKQQLIYNAMGWHIPHMAHIPLIHGPDGTKLSKRHGALSTASYHDMGYLPSALNNYLLRLGWSHGNDEIISRQQAIDWFTIDNIGKSPARIDFNKMKHLNAHYLRSMDQQSLAAMIFNHFGNNLSIQSQKCILQAIDCIKPRCELLTDLFELVQIFIIDHPIVRTPEAIALIATSDQNLITSVYNALTNISEFNSMQIQSTLKTLASEHAIAIGELMRYIRAYITGRTSSPSVFEILSILGKINSLARFKQ